MKYQYSFFQKLFSALAFVFSCLMGVAVSADLPLPDKDVQEAGETVRLMIDRQQLTQAERWIEHAPTNIQTSAPVLYERARITLKRNYHSKNDYIGYSYTPKAAKAAIQLLEKSIARDPKYAKNYSLLGHIHAVRGELKSAQNAFKKAEELSPRPLWLDYNKALLAIKQENYKEAVKLFRKNTLHNIKQNKSDPYLIARNGIYKGSWDIWKRISLDHPKLDVLTSVRKGLMKRIMPLQLPYFLKGRKKTDKAVFVYFSSSDDFCQPCLKSNQTIEKIAQELGEYYDFIVVSFESWNLVRDYPSLLKPDKLNALPAQAIFHGRKVAAFQPGNICPTFPCKQTIHNLIKFSKKK